jgi:hypothetical protein
MSGVPYFKRILMFSLFPFTLSNISKSLASRVNWIFNWYYSPLTLADLVSTPAFAALRALKNWCLIYSRVFEIVFQ